jgi:hypothetical protein
MAGFAFEIVSLHQAEVPLDPAGHTTIQQELPMLWKVSAGPVQVQVIHCNGFSAYLTLQYTNNTITWGDMCFLYV